MTVDMMEMMASLINRIESLEEEVGKLKKKPKLPVKRLAKPTINELAIEFQAKGSLTCLDDADTFFNHYESNGWKVGKNGMKNWKATVAQWHKRNQEGNTHGKDQSKAISGRDAITFNTTDF
ncbi:MAG: hypothetical protein COB66_07960 [Coxiella sp. (in: Bacteria)]|nr:MAG: hypothetical protein COB66_07960 [Coxiella sp. (in: g-proteobacteria)]